MKIINRSFLNSYNSFSFRNTYNIFKMFQIVLWGLIKKLIQLPLMSHFNTKKVF